MQLTQNSARKWMRKTKLALICLSLMGLLPGCATERLVTKTEVQKVPEALLIACPKSSLGDHATYLDVFKLAEQRGKEVDACNDQLNAIRQWSESSPQ